jgi:NAD-dependent DNA ligase
MDFKTEKELVNFLREASNAYYNTNKPIISDTQYDELYELLKTKYPKSKFLKEIGSRTSDAIELPYFLGSMNKYKNNKEINRWLSKNNHTTFICTDKLDGISALYFNNKLYTRGDGYKGRDISFLLKYLKLPKVSYAVRGELVINKKLYPNGRNIVSGIVNSKFKDITETAPLVKFIAYEIILNNDVEPSQSQQLNILKKDNFKIVTFDILSKEDLKEEDLTKLLFERKALCDFDIDGLILTPDIPYTRNTDGNPNYAFAFKVNVNEYTTTVITVDWVVSKDGYIIPTVRFEPIDVNGVTLSSAQGFNAKYILDNNIGKDTIITVVRSGDVIPYITGIVKSTKPNLPDYKYVWNKNKVHFILEDKGELTLTKELTHFLKTIGVKHFDEKIIEKLIFNGINSIKKLISIQKKDLLNIEGFKHTMADKLISQLQDAFSNLDLITLMVASNSFGHGFSFKKINTIYNEYPDILNVKYDDIKNLYGFGENTAQLFMEGLENFKKFIKKNNLENYINHKKIVSKTDKFKNLTIVFTGFRNTELEKQITEGSGKVSTSISKNTDYLIVKDIHSTSSKILKAKELKIKVLELDEFISQFDLNT